jgi:hypothetical protein
MAIRSPTGIEFVELTAIDWFEAANYYTCVHAGSSYSEFWPSEAATRNE